MSVHSAGKIFNCVAEAASWRTLRDTKGSGMSTMYVLVYDTRGQLDAEQFKECIHVDGFARTMMFVRSDDFENWCIPCTLPVHTPSAH